MIRYLTFAQVLLDLGMTDGQLRHYLRNPLAPRPEKHPSTGDYLWTTGDLKRLRRYIETPRRRGRRRRAAPEQPADAAGGSVPS